MEKQKNLNQNLKKHVIVEAKAKDIKKLNSFINVMRDVAEDMGLTAYADNTEYLLGNDY